MMFLPVRAASASFTALAFLAALPAQAQNAAASAAASLPAAAAPLASAPPLPSTTANMFQVVLGLLVVLALMALAAWLVKRLNGTRTAGGQNIRVVGGVSVGSRERVIVVEVADQWIVVGVAPGRVNALATLPRGEHPEILATSQNAAAHAPNFSAWLKQTIDKRNAAQ